MNYIDLQEQYRRYREEIRREIDAVLESSQFIMGPAVGALERELAAHTGAKHAIGCASGTDALLLGLMALGVKPGDEVIVPDFTFFATAEVVSFLGAVPVFADIDDETFNLDPGGLRRRVGPRTRGIIPVSLYGHPADIDEITEAARSRGLWVFEDAAQSYGARYKGRRSGALTELAATSFFPAKPLGCYGDGGALFTSSDERAAELRRLLNHGQAERYRHVAIGMNGRLDTLQAAVLRVKLRHFDEEMAMKRRAADRYAERLAAHVRVPRVASGCESVWAQYTIRTSKRDAVIDHLKKKGIPTAIHYPIPLHRQEVYAPLGGKDADYPVSVKAASEVVSLPMHAFLSDADIDRVAEAIIEAVR